jgi:hypothetical protein
MQQALEVTEVGDKWVLLLLEKSFIAAVFYCIIHRRQEHPRAVLGQGGRGGGPVDAFHPMSLLKETMTVV